LNWGRQIVHNETFVDGLEAMFAALGDNLARAEALADEAAHSSKSLTHTHYSWHDCAGAQALSDKPGKAHAQLQCCGDLGLASDRHFEMEPYPRCLRTTPGSREFITALRREHDSIRDEFGWRPGWMR
jgi:hypothetical protein